MSVLTVLMWVFALMTPLCMIMAALSPLLGVDEPRFIWRRFIRLSGGGLLSAFLAVGTSLFFNWNGDETLAGLVLSPLQMGMSTLVQLIGTIVGVFSSRYLEGETNTSRFVAALAGTLVAVHVFLLSDHWILLIVSWAAIGAVLQNLLCFYEERPFARLAAHKKFIADRFSDFLLIAAAIIAWKESGTVTLSALTHALGESGPSPLLQLSALALALSAILRTALFPVHGWLIQVMEAPTPVSALLHAGVVNLSAVVLIKTSALLTAAPPAQWILVLFGLTTTVLGGWIMLTRISIKVRLAWSTVVQMGFMIMECGLGLYSMAFLHLMGHSLYKAQAFLVASSAVDESREHVMRQKMKPHVLSVLLAPFLTFFVIAGFQTLVAAWVGPLWWTVILAVCLAPLCWISCERASGVQLASGLLLVVLLSGLLELTHQLPIGIRDEPQMTLGLVVMTAMILFYASLAALQLKPSLLGGLWRWSFSGFYIDEYFTRVALNWWPTAWAPRTVSPQLSERRSPSLEDSQQARGLTS